MAILAQDSNTCGFFSIWIPFTGTIYPHWWHYFFIGDTISSLVILFLHWCYYFFLGDTISSLAILFLYWWHYFLIGDTSFGMWPWFLHFEPLVKKCWIDKAYMFLFGIQLLFCVKELEEFQRNATQISWQYLAHSCLCRLAFKGGSISESNFFPMHFSKNKQVNIWNPPCTQHPTPPTNKNKSLQSWLTRLFPTWPSGVSRFWKGIFLILLLLLLLLFLLVVICPFCAATPVTTMLVLIPRALLRVGLGCWLLGTWPQFPDH